MKGRSDYFDEDDLRELLLGSGHLFDDSAEDAEVQQDDDLSALDTSPDKIRLLRDWRPLFTDSQLRDGASQTLQAGLHSFTTEIPGQYRGRHGAQARFDGTLSGGRPILTRILDTPDEYERRWSRMPMDCSCAAGRRHERCAHMAALLTFWEKQHGPWYVVESSSEYSARQQKIEIRTARNRLQQLRQECGMEQVPAVEFFADRPSQEGLVFFDVRAMLNEAVTTPYYIARAKEVLQAWTPSRMYYHKDFEFLRQTDGSEQLKLNLNFSEVFGTATVTGILSPTSIVKLEALLPAAAIEVPQEGRRGDNPSTLLNEYVLAAFSLVWDELDRQKGKTLTDDSADRFFQKLDKVRAQTAPQESEQAAARAQTLQLMPRIIMDEGEARLAVKAGPAGGRLLNVRSLPEMVSAYRNEGTFSLSNKVKVDFAALDFREEDQPFLQFLIRRVREVAEVNEKLEQRGWYGRPAGSVSVSSMMELKGSMLDNFYDVMEDGRCELTDKTRKLKDVPVEIRHTRLRFPVRTETWPDARGNAAGVVVSGTIPVRISGSSHTYTLDSRSLSRLLPEEEQALNPFTAVAAPAGDFQFRVGRERLQEFFYRVLPDLAASPFADLNDNTGDDVRSLLPPEAEFTFFLDYEDGCLYGTCTAAYGDRSFAVTPEAANARAGVPADGLQRDRDQERRVYGVLSKFFTEFGSRSMRYRQPMTEEQLFSFLQDGVEELSRYGTVQGTDAFRRLRVRPLPAVTVGVSVQSGLMDLSVTSKDLTEDELLSLMESYRQRKRYHRLRSGDFVDLTSGGVLQSLSALLDELSILPADALHKKVQMPLFRALYLEHLLETHEELVSSRDRTFRALARNFQTIRDAEYEPPAGMADTLRTYQNYGFKWLKTLENAGFGGILADEMGLGKTLQMIALIQSDKEQGNTKPSLVICPASLVYNWQEELRRFAPDLRCTVLAGTLGARKKALQQAEHTDVLVTSYDLLKRDVSLYSGLSFHICVLDEAQYIKNAKAVVTKAVKTIAADHRFALTGTPIENRLAELWSIFDFLMPGFLYSLSEFGSKFETPITKNKDAHVTERLRQMTSPFILRRRKEEVLKDLPAKLEEVRYARVTGEQQRLYDAQVVRIRELLTGEDAGGEEKMRIFAELMRIRQICCDPSLIFEGYQGESAKREACLETVQSAIDGGHRILIFSQFTSMLELLEADLTAQGIEYYKIIGSTPKDRRVALVHAFNDGDVPVFLISLKAGGTGLNLTGADVVIHYDPWWNLAAQNQATDRAHRIGQTRQVTVYRLILKDTIEERILELQEAKRDLAEAILEGEGQSLLSMSNEELLELLE